MTDNDVLSADWPEVDRTPVASAVPWLLPELEEATGVDSLRDGRAALAAPTVGVMHEWIAKYGKVFGIYMGDKPHMVLTDTDMIKECFIKPSKIFQDRPMFFIDAEPFSSALTFLKGEKWRELRSLFNTCFTTSKVKDLFSAVDVCTTEFVKKMDALSRSGHTIDVYHNAHCLTLDTLAKTVLNWQVNFQMDEANPTVSRLCTVFQQMDETAIESFFAFPLLRAALRCVYPFSDFCRNMREVSNDVLKILNWRRSPKAPREKDVLQCLIDLQTANEGATEKTRRYARALNDSTLLSNIIMLLAVGFDSTSSSLAFVFYLLAKHPEEQEKIRAEVECTLEADDILTLERLDMVVREGLRLYPALPVMILRECSQDTTILGHYIPRGTTVVAPPWHIHRDPKIWSDPDEFIPDRFAKREQSTLSSTAEGWDNCTDVCPNPNDKICLGWGRNNPTPDHRCEPRCRLCGKGHFTGDRRCKARYKTPYIVKRRQQQRKRQEEEEAATAYGSGYNSSSDCNGNAGY
ncbi:cytochrome P450 3A4-like [Dermacentor variabilis]|uniref:cytochrome P450 3A4-like n=1 Tax=Dermacentor variabilis TaxID=34621 RepID=UPI003F5B3063